MKKKRTLSLWIWLVLLGSGLGLGGVAKSGSRVGPEAVNRARARSLVEQKATELRTVPTKEVTPGEDLVVIEGTRFERRWTVESEQGSGDSAELVVAARWTQGDDRIKVEEIIVIR